MSSFPARLPWMPASLRVLSLLHLLQDREWVSGPELAARLEIDLRMLRRDVVRLGDLGIPVESRLGRHGGYRLRPGYRLPPLMLTDDEATAIALALRAAGPTGLGLPAPAIESALAKLRRVLPTRLREDLDDLEASLAFAGEVPEREPVPTANLLSLARAMSARRRIRISYARRDASPSRRELRPVRARRGPRQVVPRRLRPRPPGHAHLPRGPHRVGGAAGAALPLPQPDSTRRRSWSRRSRESRGDGRSRSWWPRRQRKCARRSRRPSPSSRRPVMGRSSGCRPSGSMAPRGCSRPCHGRSRSGGPPSSPRP